MKNDKLLEAQELERKAQELRRDAYEVKRQEELKKEEEFRTKEKLDVYTSDDYCGLTTGDYSFYYRYEITVCPVKSHRKNCEDNGCGKREWAFEAKIKGKTVMTMGKSEVHPEEREEPFWYLVAGIGHFLKREAISTPKKVNT